MKTAVTKTPTLPLPEKEKSDKIRHMVSYCNKIPHGQMDTLHTLGLTPRSTNTPVLSSFPFDKMKNTKRSEPVCSHCSIWGCLASSGNIFKLTPDVGR